MSRSESINVMKTESAVAGKKMINALSENTNGYLIPQIADREKPFDQFLINDAYEEEPAVDFDPYEEVQEEVEENPMSGFNEQQKQNYLMMHPGLAAQF